MAGRGMIDATRAGLHGEGLDQSQVGKKRLQLAHGFGGLVRRLSAVDQEIEAARRKEAAQLEAATSASRGVNTQVLRIITDQASLPKASRESGIDRGIYISGGQDEGQGVVWRGVMVGDDREPEPGETQLAEQLPTLTLHGSAVGHREFAATRVRVASSAVEADGQLQPPTSEIIIDCDEVHSTPLSSVDAVKPFVNGVRFRIGQGGEIDSTELRVNVYKQTPEWRQVSPEHNLSEFLGGVDQAIAGAQALNAGAPPTPQPVG